MSSYVQHAHSTLAQLAADGADGVRIADGIIAIWENFDAALSPIIGKRGFSALFKRSLLLTGATHTSLTRAFTDADTVDSLAALRAMLEKQTSADAIAANGALLQTFLDLLNKLIGESLTERLLQPEQGNPSGDSPAREKSP